MKNPPVALLGAALLFWGFRTGGIFLPLALVMALLHELAPRLPWRLELDKKQFQHVADFCSAAMAVTVALLAFSQPAWRVVYLFVAWLPLLLFPLLAAHRLGHRQETLPLEVLFYSLRGGKGETGRFQPGALYFAVTLLAAAIAQAGDGWLLPGAGFLVAWYLWPQRPRRFAARTWFFALTLALLTGWGVERGIVRASLFLEEKSSEWLARWFATQSFDPFQSRTALGEVGERKDSDRVVMEARIFPRAISTFLLREAVYDRYAFGHWSASDRARLRLPPPLPGAPWQWAPPAPGEQRMTIHRRFPGGKGIVAAPTGVRRIDHLLAANLYRTPLGTLQVEDVPPFAVYDAWFADQGGLESPPGPLDLLVPGNERSRLAEVAALWGLTGLPAREAMARVAERFRQEFRYTLELPGGGLFGAPVGDFLTKHKAGHCEYFATATVLLLRQAGIPARYAVGFSMQEYQPQGDLYLIRSSHAHAWAMVHDGDHWRDWDTTPPDWSQTEAAARPFWRPLLDQWDAFLFWLEVWRHAEESDAKAWLWLVPPLVLWLGWRMRRVAWRRKATGTREPASPFQPVEDLLAARYGPRPRGEPLVTWLERLGETSALPLAQWRYRMRFDPAGLSRQELALFRREVEAWVKAWGAGSPRTPPLL